MKLNKCLSALLVSSFLLTGCSTQATKDDGKYVVASLQHDGKAKNIYADDLYKTVLSTSTSQSTVFDAVLENLINKKFPVSDDMEKEADTIIDQVKSYYESSYGEEYESILNDAISSSGYKDLDDYRNAMIKEIQYAKFLLNYVDNHYDEVFDDYYKQCSPKEASVIMIATADSENPSEDEQKKIDEVTELIHETDKSFGEIAQDYSDDPSASKKGAIGLYDSVDSNQLASSYNEQVINAIKDLNEGEVSDKIVGDDGIYFVKVTNTNYDKLKKSLKDTSIDSPLLVYDTYLQYVVYDSYKLTYKDKDVEKVVTTVVNRMLVQRAKERGVTNE